MINELYHSDGRYNGKLVALHSPIDFKSRDQSGKTLGVTNAIKDI